MGTNNDHLDDSFDDDFDEDFMEEFDDDFDEDTEDLAELDDQISDLDEDEIIEEEPFDEEPAGEELFSEDDASEESASMWDEDEALSIDEEPEDEKKSSKGLLVASVIALAIAGGGYYAFQNMGKSFQLPAMIDNAEPMIVAEAEPTTSEPLPIETQISDVLTPMPEFETPEIEIAEAESMMPVQVTDIETPAFDTLPMPVIEEEIETIAPTIQSTSMPKISDIMLEAPSIGEPEVEFTELQQAIIPEPINILETEEYKAAQSEIKALQAQLVEANDRVSELRQDVIEAKEATPTQSVDTSGFENKISTQLKEIKAKEARINLLETEVSALTRKNNSLVSEKKTMERELMAKNKLIAEQRRKAQQAETRVTIRKPATVVRPDKIEWSLRSVQPGIAWLSKKGENEMVRVEVGESVQGLGTIKSISMSDGFWVVKGSQGTVKQ